MSHWFVQQMDAEIGPMTGAELLKLVRQGTVKAETLVRKDDSAWFAAVEVGGLFDAATNRMREFHCPDCDGVVAKPPSVCPGCGKHLAYAPTRLVEERHGGHGVSAVGVHRRTSSAQRWLQKIKAPREDDE